MAEQLVARWDTTSLFSVGNGGPPVGYYEKM